ncbi:sulfotransferase family protein [Parapedobacter indicus]|uniref:Sulfotransferase n=1 Tax=Parapedobacter indicus TaxID=1477437 RepID=A0A1I3TIF8_9SPHI|nr:sulfotransferase [Parapedobacter indicus]PPK99485.1 sulfotransferase [Parapedobacter indicus]SFJ70293.1 sulfotransferase [Parapedobacter indicus]
MKHFHFISGLPRSGSTLLSGILTQNPNVHAAMSSPVASLINGCLEQIGAGSEFYSFFDEKKRKTICSALFNAYYQDNPKDVIFDTNRLWTARMHQLVELFDDFKVVCLVRDPAWIMDSFEKIYRKNPFDYSRMFSAGNRATVYTRCESLLNGVVGIALTALKEAFYGEYADRLLLVDYELLARFPEKTLKLIYEFTGVAPYRHDFDNVEYSHDEFDYTLGVKGLHTVARKVAFKQRRSILPPDLFQKYSEMAFWKDTAGSDAHVIAPKEHNLQQTTK